MARLQDYYYAIMEEVQYSCISNVQGWENSMTSDLFAQQFNESNITLENLPTSHNTVLDHPFDDRIPISYSIKRSSKLKVSNEKIKLEKQVLHSCIQSLLQRLEDSDICETDFSKSDARKGIHGYIILIFPLSEI